VADCRQVMPPTTQPLRFHTRVAGVFLFLPLLARVSFAELVATAAYPGSRMVPAASALLSLLTLKLLDKERHSHIDDFNFDEALGLFVGLNVLPKKSFASDYSSRTQRDQQQRLLAGWVERLSPVLMSEPGSLALDFHPIPYRGEDALLENHYVPCRGQASPSVQTFFALEQQSRVFCYANTNLTRDEQAGELMRFVEFWHDWTGTDPHWLYFDYKLTTNEQLSRVNQRAIHFVTIRRRGSSLLRRLARLPESAWTPTVIDIPKRRHQRIHYVDERVQRADYDGAVRQLAVTGLGCERLNVDLDVMLTVIAHGCYRWLAD
jgi:hypothetical protein